ncbi:Ribonuclease T2-like [Dillenia turbinata]|uniref:Ribonuclease T2-like n=1 Tax=Dillenia turbinata TaxID=194707 RepID=A0AAN8ZKW3_9MAGN
MASLPLLILIFTLLFLTSNCELLNVNHSGGENRREFDYFALALQWPGTYCQRSRYCCSYNACCRGSNAPTEFTIHGLWPDYNDGTWPACCTKSSFDIKEISTLRDALEKYWPSLSCGSPSTCHRGRGTFWGHEVSVLFEAGYVPSNSERYPLGGIISAIEIAFRATPLVHCSNGAVEELQLCFYKDFKPRDCVIRSSTQMNNFSESSCPEYVSLPVFSGLGNVEDSRSTIGPEAI